MNSHFAPLLQAESLSTGPETMESKSSEGFPGGSVVKNLPASGEDTGLIPDLGRCRMPQSNEAHARN